MGRSASGRREGAKIQRTRWRDRLRAWVRHHRFSAADSLRRVLDRPGSSLLTWLAVGVALAMPVSLALSLDNLRALGGNVDTQAHLSLFLTSTVEAPEAQALALSLAAREDIETVTFRSREDALAEFRDRSGFADVLGGLDNNPLPHVLLVAPAVVSTAADLSVELALLPAVDEVVLDVDWVDRLQRLMALGRRLVLVLGLVLCGGVVLILGNTIRLSIEGRREEILVTRLVGASDAFVRRPFLYSGLWYGVGGGAAAWLLVVSSFWSLKAPVARLAQAYGANWQLNGPAVVDGAGLVLAGGALGLVAAWVAVARHLRDAEIG